MISSVDIAGIIPKWIVNLASKNATREWFVNYEKNCIAYDVKLEKEGGNRIWVAVAVSNFVNKMLRGLHNNDDI